MHPDLVADTALHLDAIAKQAFELLAGMAPESPSLKRQKPDSLEVKAWVSYDGGKRIPSRLLLTANTRFAVDFSQRFLGLPGLKKVDDDVLDAMGELANTVGGNFKGLCSADTILSTPVVLKVHRDSELCPGGITLAELDYAFEGDGYCQVRLLGPDEK